MDLDLKNEKFAAAVNALERRAERQESDLPLYNTYVDNGVLQEISNRESQVIYGRRGVGKTHLLHFHRHAMALKGGSLYFIFDCQTLGSGIAGMSADPKVVAHNYAFELLNELGTRLFDCIPPLKLPLALESSAQKAALLFVDHICSKDGSFDYRNLDATFNAFCDHVNVERIYISLDEFVSIPQSAQPLFAHILKQLFASNRRVVFKIAAVTFQTTLSSYLNGQQVGLEIGADVFGDIDLDSYFLWDEQATGVLSFFSEVLYNHLGELLGWNLSEAPARKKEFIISVLFTQEKCFQELVRASEGNCRDLLNIFRLAYSEFRRSESSKITLEHVTTAAKTWYRNAKLANISPDTKDEAFLNFLIQEVIKEKRSRAFMVHYQAANHPLLIRLLNLRLLHRMRTTWTHPDRPGDPHHIFTIDYGCYADLKNTRSEPEQLVFLPDSSAEKVAEDYVPLPDRRSIRRIVVERADLNKFYVKQ